MLPNIPKQIAELAMNTTSKPISAFSEFISLKLFGKSIGKLRAEAENEYNKIKQLGEIQNEVNRPFIVEIETAKAYRQYANLGSTLLKATPLITSDINNVKEDNDVFWGLLEHAKDISNEDMQTLIAKIIAGEYNSPETYSMSTLQVLKSLGKKEVKLFENICSLLINNNQLPSNFFSDIGKDLMNSMNFDFRSLLSLQSLGLFLPNGMTLSIQNSKEKNLVIKYFDKEISFKCEVQDSMRNLQPFYSLSLAGAEILQHLNPKFKPEFYEWLKNNYKIADYKIVP